MSRRSGMWWWIDRWRKSTAFTDMTLAEQGAYRNLIDELNLRGGVLPNDERILGRACGDPVEWPAVRARVLTHFELTPEGYRHMTHDEIAAKTEEVSQRQAEKGRQRVQAAVRGPAGRFQPNQPRYQPRRQPPAGERLAPADRSQVTSLDQPDQPNDQPSPKFGQPNQPENHPKHQPDDQPRDQPPDPDPEDQDHSVHRAREPRYAFQGRVLALTHGQHEVLVRMLNGVELDLLGEVYPRWNRMLKESGEPFDTLDWCTAQLKREVGIRRPNTPSEADYREAEGIVRRALGDCTHQPRCPDRETCLGAHALKVMLRRTKPLRVRA